jgi:hypothetical protein
MIGGETPTTSIVPYWYASGTYAKLQGLLIKKDTLVPDRTSVEL